MQIDVQHRPAYALATVMLDAGEACIAEGGAMVSKDTHVTIATSATSPDPRPQRYGCLPWFFRSFGDLFRSRAVFHNKFEAASYAGAVTFAPKAPGDIVVQYLDESTGLVLQSTAFLCSASTVGLDNEWGGTEAFLRGDGMLMVRANGEGLMAFSSFGYIREIQVDQAWEVDAGHVVAFEDSLSFEVRRHRGGLLQRWFGGEDWVVEFHGQGRVWLQSHNPKAYGRIIGPMLPKRRR
ncbi:MAG: TIGR00266 family protein [Myxococcota bacterium]